MISSIKSDLQGSTPEAEGIASTAIFEFIEAVEKQIHELHSFMLLRHGKVVAEGWWSPYEREIPHMLFSLSKSFSSTAIGLAVEEGLLSIDDSVISFFPDDKPAEISEFLAAMKVRHLLSMSTGHDVDTMDLMINNPSFNWVKNFLEIPVLHEPGTHFLYNTGATYMLSAIVQKISGMKLVDYLKPRLFEPLGIEQHRWEESPQGISMGGFGLNTTTESIARFGQLYLQKGLWEGKRILSEAWIEEATSFQVSNGNKNTDSDWTQGYGYQFWRCRHNLYRGDGAFGQYCIVMPEQDAVLAITGGVADMQIPLNLVWEHLLPAMGKEALAEDTAAQAKLSDKLSKLKIAPITGEAQSTLSSQVSGKTYSIAENDLNAETLSFNFTESGAVLNLKMTWGEEAIQATYGAWQQGQTKLFNPPWESEPVPFVAGGAWISPDSFKLVIRLYETPFFHSFVFNFAGDELLLEAKVNVAFGSTSPRQFKAKLIS